MFFYISRRDLQYENKFLKSSSPYEIGLRNYVIEQNTKSCQDFLTVLFPQETISSFSLTFPHSLFCVSSKKGESNQKY